MSGPEIVSRRRGVYIISDLEVARLLNVPAGQTVAALSIDWQASSLLVLVEGDGLPEVYEGASAPYLNKYGRMRSLSDWANCDVSKLPPAAAHTAVLAELGAVRFEDPATRAGRRRILDRHAPHAATAPPCCSSCVEYVGGDREQWPCEDYLDAAAGLVTGLPGQAERDAAIISAAIEATADQSPRLHAQLTQLAGEIIDPLVLGDPSTAHTAPPDRDARPGVESDPRRHRRTPPASRTEQEG